METPANRPVLAAVLVLSAMAMFGLIDNFMRLAAETGGLWQFHLLRALVALVLIVLAARIMRIPLTARRPGRVLVRSTLNAAAMVVYFGSLGMLPIAQAAAGLFTAPLFVVLFGMLLFGEKVGPRRLFAVVVGFVGILLALRPEAGALSPLSAVPILAGAFYGLGNLVTRHWCAGEATLTLLGGFFAMMAVFGALGVAVLTLWGIEAPAGAAGYLTRGWVSPDAIFTMVIVVQAAGSVLGVGMIIRAYQITDATTVAVFENTLLLFATVWAAVLWQEWPDALGLLGLALVASAGVLIALRSPAPKTAIPAK